jgi:purine-binding chemotaxis protein CheW
MSQHTQEITNTSSKEGKHLTFQLAAARYGVDILQVQEIICVPPITRVPQAPQYIQGVINLRGRIIPVMNLRTRFGLPTIKFDEKSCIIVVIINKNSEKIALGVIVDTVLEVIDFSNSEIEPTPDYGVTLDTSFIKGIGRKSEESLNVLIDIDKLLNNEDRINISNLSN